MVNGKKRDGYTLVELITVVVIIGLLTLASLPAFNNMRKGARLKASARRVTSALRYARRLAITMNSIYSVVFNQTNNTFGVINGFSGSDTIEKRFSLDETISFDSDGYPIKNFPNDIVQFKPNGSAKRKGTIWIKSTDGSYFHITVVNTSGRTRIYPGATH